ncbi:hypothetical protein XM50_08870 [Sphingomonas sp. Ag1]|nr:hypothetical protein XM50_08870 [Sphingomonas sp. Ag1]
MSISVELDRVGATFQFVGERAHTACRLVTRELIGGVTSFLSFGTKLANIILHSFLTQIVLIGGTAGTDR